MPIYNETWNENDYLYGSRLNLKSLTRNHLLKLKSLKFDFIEYKANQLLACHVYEKMTLHCMNQYGLFEDSYRPECYDAKNYFYNCVKTHQAYGLQKEYFPEAFVTSPYARPVPTLQEI